MSSPLILLIFFYQGLGLEAAELQKKSQLLKVFCWGFVISQILGPALGYFSVLSLNWHGDNQVGFILICSMAPTLVSGAVLASRGGGDAATALILAVGINLLGIVTIPFNLQWSLGAVVRLDTAGLILKLIFLVLVPAVVGQLIRHRRPNWAQNQQKFIQNGPIIAMGIIVYLSCSSQADRLKELTPILAPCLFPRWWCTSFFLWSDMLALDISLGCKNPLAARWLLSAPRKPCQLPLRSGPLLLPKSTL